MPDASVKLTYSTQITHIGSGASMAAGAMSASSDISTALSSTNLSRYPRADVQLYFQHTATMSSASAFVTLYRRDLNFDGANDEPIPTTATATLYKAKYAGTFIVQPQSATSASYSQYAQITDVPLSDGCEFYIENTSNTSLLAGWTLKVVPKTDVGATS